MGLDSEIFRYSNKRDAVFLQRFYKTGKGEYGEGDKFLGVRMPVLRRLAITSYGGLTYQDVKKLLQSEYHEVRMCGLLVLLYKFKKAEIIEKQKIYELYLEASKKVINNWDLVDVTAPHIVGAYLIDKPKKDLYKLAKGNLWQKRISIISTFWFIKYNRYQDSIKLAKIFVYEDHDLLHKAVGWVLREVGKKEPRLMYEFLDEYASSMPRTALRYALEKTPSDLKKYYMGLKAKA